MGRSRGGLTTKIHALVDADGRALLVEPHPGDMKDRGGAGPLLAMARPLFAFIKHVWADGRYNHERVPGAANIIVEIVRKNPDQVGFPVSPRRWVVERFFAWIGRNRRSAKDFQASINSAAAFLYAASLMLLVRRLERRP